MAQWSGQKEESTESSSQPAFDEELAAELDRIQFLSDGTEVPLERIEYDGDGGALVHFDPPLSEPFRRRWEVPKTPDQNTMFTALCDYYGKNLDSAPQIPDEDMGVPFTYEDDTWVCQLEVPEEPLREKVSLIGALKNIALFPVIVSRGAIAGVGPDDETFGGKILALTVIFIFFPLASMIFLGDALDSGKDVTFGAWFFSSLIWGTVYGSTFYGLIPFLTDVFALI